MFHAFPIPAGLGSGGGVPVDTFEAEVVNGDSVN